MKTAKIDPSFYQKLSQNLILSDQNKIRTIISFKSIKNREVFVSNNSNLKVLNYFDVIPSVLIEVNKEKILELSENDLIEKIEEDQRLYQSIDYCNELISINKFKDSLYPITGKNVSLALIDSGIDKTCKSLDYSQIKQINLTNEEPSNDNFHATLIAHILKNLSPEFGKDFLGLCPDIELFDFKVFNKNGVAYFSNVLEAIDYIFDKKLNLDIILLTCTTLAPSNGEDILSESCDILSNSRDTIIIASTGNFGPESDTIGSPGLSKSVITVGGTSKQSIISYFSGIGSKSVDKYKPEVYFPGSKITIPVKGIDAYEVSGTSISAAICAGIISLIKEAKPHITKDEILELFSEAKRPILKYKMIGAQDLIDVVRVFTILDLYEEKPIPYSALIKKSVKISIYFIALLITAFFLIRLIDFILI